MLQPWELEMGLIDSVLGGLLGGQNTSSPIGGILSNILQGGSSRGGFGPSGMGADLEADWAASCSSFNKPASGTSPIPG
jgi:hypothetical protein